MERVAGQDSGPGPLTCSQPTLGPPCPALPCPGRPTFPSSKLWLDEGSGSGPNLSLSGGPPQPMLHVAIPSIWITPSLYLVPGSPPPLRHHGSWDSGRTASQNHQGQGARALLTWEVGKLRSRKLRDPLQGLQPGIPGAGQRTGTAICIWLSPSPQESKGTTRQ